VVYGFNALALFLWQSPGHRRIFPCVPRLNPENKMKSETRTFLITVFVGLVVAAMVIAKFLSTGPAEQPQAGAPPVPAPPPTQAPVGQPVSPVSWQQANGGQPAKDWDEDRRRREAVAAEELRQKQAIAAQLGAQQASRQAKDQSEADDWLRRNNEAIRRAEARNAASGQSRTPVRNSASRQ
jgi:hypothetical protein